MDPDTAGESPVDTDANTDARADDVVCDTPLDDGRCDPHLDDVPDGSGCTEIWEHLSENRDRENRDRELRDRENRDREGRDET